MSEMHKTLNTFLKTQTIDQNLKLLFNSIAESAIDIADHLSVKNTLISDNDNDNVNVQGEKQQPLDIIANDIIKKRLLMLPMVKGFISEEEDTFHVGEQKGEYLVAFDPLDGSSNLMVHGLVGSIFSVLPASSGMLSEKEFLQEGKAQVASCYFLYGYTTLMMFSCGTGLFLFQYRKDLSAFILIKENIQLPYETPFFYINMSNQRFWHQPMQKYIADCLLGKEGERKKDFNMRWIASMVGDIHRTILMGGIFCYPSDYKNIKQPNKLRILYEANPMSFLIHQGSGLATTGYQMILDIQPSDIHQRVSVIMGSAHEVQSCLSYFE